MRPLAVPDDLRNLMQEDVPEATALQNVALASGAVRGRCGWRLTRGTDTERVRMTTPYNVWLRTMFLVSVESLSVDGLALAPLTLEWEEFGRVGFASRFWPGRSVASVTYTHGYLDDDYRLADIKGVVLSVAARLTENPTALRSYTIGAEAFVAAGGGGDVIGLLAESERTQLEPYRLPVLG